MDTFLFPRLCYMSMTVHFFFSLAINISPLLSRSRISYLIHPYSFSSVRFARVILLPKNPLKGEIDKEKKKKHNGIVTSTVVEEAVSGAVSFVFSSRKEVSQEDLMERLEMAHINLDLALERVRMMPITIIALLRKRNKLKDVFKECDDLLDKARNRQQVVPSLYKRIMYIVLPSFIVPSQDLLSSSVVRRFEWFAKEARRFVRDVESRCSPSRYRFHNPLIRNLLEGKDLSYEMVQDNQTCCLWISTASVEEYGRVAWLGFQYEDRKVPLKSFKLMRRA